MWQILQDSFSNPIFRGGMWTLLTLVVTVILYVRIKRRLISEDDTDQSIKSTRRLLRRSLLFLVTIILITLWTAVLTESPQETAFKVSGLLYKVLWTCGIGVAIYLVVGAVQRPLSKDISSIEARHKMKLVTNWTGIALFIIAVAIIWMAGVRDFGIFLGIVGAGLALSLQEILVSIAGWLVYVVRRPYDIGDRIEIEGKIGDVIGVSVFQTTMLEVGNWVGGDQSTGRMLIIPNSMIVRYAVYNYGRGFPFVWDEISIIVTFESDWQEAESLMMQKAEVESDKIAPKVERLIKRMQSRYAIRYEHLTPIVYTSIADNGVELTLRYLCPVRDRRMITHRLSRNILQAFIDHPTIDFAYNTTRIFRNNEEGKPGTGRRKDSDLN